MANKKIKEIQKTVSGGHQMQREFMNFVHFIALVRAGEQAMILAHDYVVTNDATYREYCKKKSQTNVQAILFDEADTIPPAPKKANRRKKT